MIELTKKELEKLKLYNNGNKGNIYKINNSTAYKIYKDEIFLNEKEKNIDYMLTKPLIINSGFPKEKIILKETKKFIGYEMNIYENSKTFNDLINNNNYSLEQKKQIIKDIYIQLRKLHSYNMIAKDIHMDNFIANNKGHLIDLDEAILPGGEYIFFQKYLLRKNDKSPDTFLATKQTDNVKSIINSLSLIYDYNFEEEILKNNDLNIFLENYKYIFSKEQYKYFKEIFELNKLIYFDEIIDTIEDEEKIKYKSKKILKK